MTIPFDSASVYTDFDALDDLRLSAGKHDRKALEAAAKQFEALFVQQMLKSMRDASLAEGALDSDESRFYLDMYDKQISLSMTEGKGLGLADMIINQLGATWSKDEGDKTNLKDDDKNIVTSSIPNSVKTTASDTESRADLDFSTADDFIKKLWPMANQAASQLGVDPKIILAQAALETGWGKYVNKHDDGRSSYNIFNIKADSRWQGETISVSSLEFKNDIPVKENSRFRSYQNITESFQDYADFIKSSSRYQKALHVADNSEQYIQELQRAGYATDPEYSKKIMRIVNEGPFQETLSAIKVSLNETITSIDGSQ